MSALRTLSDAAYAAFTEAVNQGNGQRAIRLKRIINAVDRELDGTAHHPDCACNSCYRAVGDPA